MRNDYKVICEKKYYVVFTDGQGKEQKIEIPKEVAQVIQGEQTRENTIRRSEERHTVSFDAMDYEGDFFASYDSYELDGEKTELSREEKVRAVLKAMKPRQAELLRLVYLSHYTHERIAAEKGVSRPAVTQQIRTAEAAFKAIPRNSDGEIAKPDFSSDNTKIRRL